MPLDEPGLKPPVGPNRRGLMQRIGLSAAGAVAMSAAGTAGLALSSRSALAQAANTSSAPAVTDADIFNFALNLEYLEAEYYLIATTGTGLPADLTTGVGNQGNVIWGHQVPFKQASVAGFAERIAQDELGHVMFIRQALGSAAVAEPEIDLQTSFTTLAVAAGLIQSGQTFDPFADDLSFLLGAYIFEDVGVTAYAGAAPLLSSKANLGYAARILGTEGYHAGAIRAELSEAGQGEATDAISALRAKLSGVNDFGTRAQGSKFNFTNVNKVGLSFARTAGQVLAIVYGGGTNSGLFFPNGVNGTINTAS